MEYKVIKVDDWEEIDIREAMEEEVAKYIEMGWKPTGGISVKFTPFRHSDSAITTLFQAMVKE